MPDASLPKDADDAVLSFARQLAVRGAEAPDRLLIKLDGPGGMARLCAVEAAIARLLPSQTAKELVWLTRAPGTVHDTLRLSAFAADGELLCEATFELAAQMQAA